MNTMQMLQQVSPAAVIVALVALPWLAALLMHAASAGSKAKLGDNWTSRADAASRWGVAAAPAYEHRNVVLQFSVRGDEQANVTQHVPEYLRRAA